LATAPNLTGADMVAIAATVCGLHVREGWAVSQFI